MSPLSIPDLHQMPVPSREEIAERVALQELFDALSWGASLFLGNCRRLNNVFDGTPEVFVTKYFPNPNRVPDTLAGIVDPGPERGRDEHHCFCRLARAMQAILRSRRAHRPGPSPLEVKNTPTGVRFRRRRTNAAPPSRNNSPPDGSGMFGEFPRPTINPS